MIRLYCVASLLTASLALGGQPAFADFTGDQCIAANAKAQLLRREGKLSAAHEQLTLCVDTHCPGMVRDDCARRLDELDGLQPTIVFDAKDSAGGDVSAVKVAVDGRPLTERLDGSPLSLDPGPHTFTFDVAGQPTTTRRIVLKEGEKGRIEHIVVVVVAAVPSASPTAPGAPLPIPPPSETAAGGLGTRKTTALVLMGVGVAGVAAGTVFGLMAGSAWNESKQECAPGCAPPAHAQAVTDHDKAVSDGTFSTLGFIAGGALLAGGAVLFFTAPSASDAVKDHAGRLTVVPSFGPTVATLSLKSEF
jgi:hypothetical protein